MENEQTIPTEAETIVTTEETVAQQTPTTELPAAEVVLNEPPPTPTPVIAPPPIPDAPPTPAPPAQQKEKAAKRDSSVVTSIRFTAEEWQYLQNILKARQEFISKKTGKPLSESMHNMLRQLINYGINHDAHPDWFFSKPDIKPVYFK